jgi:hypothetical protein
MTMALLNDGTKGFATRVDPTQHMLGSCFHNYRNTDEPVFVKITYKDKTLSVRRFLCFTFRWRYWKAKMGFLGYDGSR